MPKRDTHTLADLRPNTTIECMACDQAKPAAGAMPFHKLMVCADCQVAIARREQRKTPKEQPHG